MAEEPRRSDNNLSALAAEHALYEADTISRLVRPAQRIKVFYLEGLCTDWTPTSPAGTTGHLTVRVGESEIQNVLWNRPDVPKDDVLGQVCRILVTPTRVLFDDIIPHKRSS